MRQERRSPRHPWTISTSSFTSTVPSLIATFKVPRHLDWRPFASRGCAVAGPKFSRNSPTIAGKFVPATVTSAPVSGSASMEADDQARTCTRTRGADGVVAEATITADAILSL